MSDSAKNNSERRRDRRDPLAKKLRAMGRRQMGLMLMIVEVVEASNSKRSTSITLNRVETISWIL